MENFGTSVPPPHAVAIKAKLGLGNGAPRAIRLLSQSILLTGGFKAKG